MYTYEVSGRDVAEGQGRSGAPAVFPASLFFFSRISKSIVIVFLTPANSTRTIELLWGVQT